MVELTNEEPMPPAPADAYEPRHIGSSEADLRKMLERVGYGSLDELSAAVIPEGIAIGQPLRLPAARGEREVLGELCGIAAGNQPCRSFIGAGYYDCITPPVIQRNILENPGWYTQYTPYQPEISQGRLEALLNFQTMVSDLTSLPLANASLLDEATAAAEAMAMCRAISRVKADAFFVAADCHPQTIAVVRTRARAAGIEVRVGEVEKSDFSTGDLFGVLLQCPATDGRIRDDSAVIEAAHAAGAVVVMATDLLALTLMRPPGEIGADIAIGSSQRFGVPLGYGGPHAAFLATKEVHKRQMPGRIVGVSKDDRGGTAYRLALQTREQHIRRDKAPSNICTAQVLLAIMAGMYAVYHGPEGLRRIAGRVQAMTRALAAGLTRLGVEVGTGPYFDTLRVAAAGGTADDVIDLAAERRVNLRRYEDGSLGISLDETTGVRDLETLLECFAAGREPGFPVEELLAEAEIGFAAPHRRESEYLTHEVFQRYRTEHELLRYIRRLQDRDLSLAHSMIPLGSCTMKLNPTTAMLPVTWPQFSAPHPFAPEEQVRGYAQLLDQLGAWLAEITGLAAVSFQPNSGAQGEYTGLLTIRAYHEHRGEGHRRACLIPTSAHGTNPASAVMAGMRVVPVACDAHGNIDLEDLEAKAAEQGSELAALMITYPSTHGVFEQEVRRICEIVHANGGQVYLDGANMNAQVGLCRPGDYGADVCHLNLHKTFCIPHGGGGPGMGPIAVAEHLAPFLPGHPMLPGRSAEAIGPVAAAPYGSPSILPISWAYIAMMGEPGLKKASQVAVLNANYMASRLEEHYPVLYTGRGGLVAHEFIIDLRPFKQSAGVTVDDVAKRLMDFGIHAPTMSFPVVGTMMIEPTESESLEELERFCEAMIVIREEIGQIEAGRIDLERSPLRRAPHTAEALLDSNWDRPYSRETGAYPAPWVRGRKFWPAVGRIDHVWGDRNLVCACPPMDEYLSEG